MAGDRSPKPPKIGATGLPNLDELDYERTSTRATDTNVTAPISTRGHARPAITVVAGADAGRVYVIPKNEITIGRATTCDLVLTDPGVSRMHAKLARSEGGFVVSDLGSKNGTIIDDRRIRSQEIAFGDAVQIGPHVLVRLSMMTLAEERMQRDLYDSSMRDALTKTYNRRYFFDRLGTEIAFAARHRTQLSVLAVDVDHFKRVNDTHGHKGGDAALKQVVQRMLATLRAEDVLARLGGEEFGVLLRGIGHDDAVVCAERLRASVGDRPMDLGGTSGVVTVSLGVACAGECDGPVTPERLFEVADERLYRAKSAGRNRVHASG